MSISPRFFPSDSRADDDEGGAHGIPFGEIAVGAFVGLGVIRGPEIALPAL